MAGDPRLRIIHELEQLGALLKDMAPLLGAFRDNLIEAGYTREEAVAMTTDLLLEMYREARQPEE